MKGNEGKKTLQAIPRCKKIPKLSLAHDANLVTGRSGCEFNSGRRRKKENRMRAFPCLKDTCSALMLQFQ